MLTDSHGKDQLIADEIFDKTSDVCCVRPIGPATQTYMTINRID
jgi:hypothetical protein